MSHSGYTQHLGDLEYPGASIPLHDLDKQKVALLAGTSLSRATSRLSLVDCHAHAASRKGLWHYIRSNPITIYAAILGTFGATACFLFTRWLSMQIFSCPTWSINCRIVESVAWIEAHLALVQGLVSFVYRLSLTALAYTAYIMGEVSLWPLLTNGRFTLKSIDTFVSASRGSIVSLPLAIFKIRQPGVFKIIVCIAAVTAFLQTEAVLVGIVYNRQNVTTDYISVYNYGGGTGFGFSQSSPPGAFPAAMTLATTLYTSWAYGLSDEPMPMQRDFLMDRSNLSLIGDISIQALKGQKSVNCVGQALKFEDYEGNDAFVAAATDTDDGWAVNIRLQQELTVWVDRIEYVSDTRSISTVVFAAINGTIENGTLSAVTAAFLAAGMTSISAVACSVDVELVESSFVIGDGSGSDPITINSLETFRAPGIDNHLPGGNYSQLATWLAVAIVGYGPSVYGCQPMFQQDVSLQTYQFDSSSPTNIDKVSSNLVLPVIFTSSEAPSPWNSWTLANLTNFIDVGSGAIAIALSRQWYEGSIDVPSRKPSVRLVSARSYILLGPMIAILLLDVLLAVLVSNLHRFNNVPRVNHVKAMDIVESTQTAEIREAASVSRNDRSGDGGLESLVLRYGVVRECYAGLGTKDNVSPFVRGITTSL